MLVLSRRAKEKVRFPSLGITVEVLRTRSSKVQLGIDAPLDIRVLRDELDLHHPAEHSPTPLCPFDADDVRDSLDAARASIQHAKCQLGRGSMTTAEQSLQLALSYLHRLEDQLSESNVSDSAVVREAATNYQVGPGLSQIVDEFLKAVSWPGATNPWAAQAG